MDGRSLWSARNGRKLRRGGIKSATKKLKGGKREPGRKFPPFPL